MARSTAKAHTHSSPVKNGKAISLMIFCRARVIRLRMESKRQ